MDSTDNTSDGIGPMSSALSWPGPRTVLVPRTEHGFGFTLRHFIVYPPESAVDNANEGELVTDENDPEGRRVKRTKLSSLEPMDTIFVKHVKEGGPAHLAGLNTGDRIVSVNGDSVTGKSYSQVIALIQSSDVNLKLLVVPKDEDILQMAYQSSVYDKTQETFRSHSDSVMTSASQGNYVKVEHAGIASAAEVTVRTRGGGWREELRRKYSSPPDESSYGSKPDRESKSVSWQGAGNYETTREPLRGDSVSNRNTERKPASFDIHISYNQGYSSPQKVPSLGLYYPLGRKDSRGEAFDISSNSSRSNSNSSSSLSTRQSQECVSLTTGSQERVGLSQSNWGRGVQDNTRVSQDNTRVSQDSTRVSQDNSRVLQENTRVSQDKTRVLQDSTRVSQENVPYSTRRSKDSLRQSQEELWTRPYSSVHSHTWDSSKPVHRTLGMGSSSEHFPRSLTTPALSKMSSKTSTEYNRANPQSLSGSNLWPLRHTVSNSTSNLPQNGSPTRLIHYNPPNTSTQSQLRNSPISTSADNLQNMSGFSIHPTNSAAPTMGHPPAYSSSSSGGSRFHVKDSYEPNIPERTFVVRIGDKVTVSPPSGNQPPQYNSPLSITTSRSFPTGPTERPSGTTFALTRAPADLPYSLRKKPQLPVSERKKQFESSLTLECQQAPLSPPSYEMSKSTKRYKSELEKLQNSGKLSNIVRRVAHFEVNPSEANGSPQSQQLNDAAQQQQEILQAQQIAQQQQQQHFRQQQQKQQQQKQQLQQQSQQPAIKVRKIATERYQPQDIGPNGRPNSSGGGPVRVLIPQSTSAPTSPTTEMSDVGIGFDDQSQRTGSVVLMDSHPMSTSMIVPSSRMTDSVDGPFGVPDRISSLQASSRPTRKVSYLTAVNAPFNKQEDLTILSSPPEITLSHYDLDLGSQATCISTHDLDLSSYTGCPVTAHTVPGCQSVTSHKRSRSSFSFFSNATSGLLSAFTTLTAVMTASSENVDRAGYKSEEAILNAGCSNMAPPPPPGVKSTSMPSVSASVIMRKKAEVEDEAIKLHRRTSYLMATAKERTTLTLPLDKTGTNTAEQPTSPAKNASMKKLKHLFVEKSQTPRIAEISEVRKSSQELPSPIHDMVKEGFLCCKTAITDGKRSSDRSWKPVWSVLRGHALYLFKDKKDSSGNPMTLDEQPISIKSCLVDIANDYTKKKNVFRLKTYNCSEYLLQAEDQEQMSGWIQAIQNNNDPDGDEKGVVMTDFMIRKTTQYEQTSTTKMSPQTQHSQKGNKKLSGLSFKAKLSNSPNIKRKKPEDGSRAKESKTWRKLGKSFRRFGGGGSSAVEEEPVLGTFCIPLEDCVPSPDNEFVPLIVEICTKIVEARGLEIVGIYRVPGNTAAVNMMQDELDRGFENMNSDNDKWLDVHVISSLLKAFFRKLPEPLITDDLYQSFINANRSDDPMRRMLSLKRLIHELPECHFETFRHLAAHLKNVAINEEFNKMDSRNLAIVFGPTLIRRKDEDMATLVKDMSDQCRIVESVLVNNEWFFSTWEEDNVVPVETSAGGRGPVSSMNHLLPKLAKLEDDRNKEINPKDIVSSIIQAANKKLKRKDKKLTLGTSDEGELSECEPNERNIDQEVARRRAKSEEILNTQDSTSETSTSSASKSFDNPDSQERPDSVYVPKMSLPLSQNIRPESRELTTEDYMDWVFVRTQSDSQQQLSRPGQNRPPSTLSRHYSDESLLDKNDELEISHGSLSNSYSLSRETLDRLRRIEFEARALREREEHRQRERDKRRVEQQRIEQELARTKKELEIEDSHSLEDLLRHTEFAMQISDFASRLTDLNGRGGVHPDSYSLMSEYSTTSSEPKDFRGHSRRPLSACGPNSVRLEGSALRHPEGASGGGSGHAQRPMGMVCDRWSNQSDILDEKQGGMGKRAGSLETIIDVKCNNGKRASGRRSKRESDRSSHLKTSEQGEVKTVTISRTGSVRRGSLDSLRDFYDKQDHRASWASTDSEDGSDLLTSLTTTFDQKLQILLNPKFKLNGPVRKQLSRPESASSPSTASDSTDGRESVAAVQAITTVTPSASKPEELPVPKIFPLPQKQPQELSLTQKSSRLESGFERPFRDPSLHRMHRPDAKIGIASRFERGTTTNSANIGGNQMSASTSSLPSGFAVTGYQVQPVLSLRDRPDGLDSKIPGVKYVVPLPSSKHQSDPPLSQKSSQGQSAPIRGEAKPFNVRVVDSRPITKSEKTEVNLSLSKLSREDNSDKGGNRRSRELAQVYGLASGEERTSGSMDDLTDKNSKSAGASSMSPKKKDRRNARRHTVGGVNDTEHFKAMVQLSQAKEEARKVSAWEQLQPAVKGAGAGQSRSLITWLQKERLRMSMSDLLGVENRTLSSSCSNLDETRC